MSSFSKWLGLMLTVSVLIGCAATPSTSPVDTNVTPERGPAETLQFFERMVGKYQSTGSVPVSLEVEAYGGNPPSQARRLLWTQSESHDPQNARVFLIGMTTTPSGLSGEFAPAVGGVISEIRCRLQWRALPSGIGRVQLLGNTLDQSCRFGQGNQSRVLRKEIVFDGSTLRIADQVIREGASRTALDAPIQRSEFVKVLPVSVRAGVKEGAEWRVAHDALIDTDGIRRAPTDAAGMSLGFGVSLRMERVDDRLQWRLVISDEQSGEVLGQTWADARAQHLGWASETIQVEASL